MLLIYRVESQVSASTMDVMCSGDSEGMDGLVSRSLEKTGDRVKGSSDEVRSVLGLIAMDSHSTRRGMMFVLEQRIVPPYVPTHPGC